MSKSTKRKHPSKKDSKQIDKNENNINKHKNYLQSKNLKRNRNQSNEEEHQDVHQWPKRSAAILGSLMVLAIKEELLSKKKHQVKVRCCRGATVEDIFEYVKPIVKRNHDYVLLHVGTNNTKDMT